jgi:hypothetical protein
VFISEAVKVRFCTGAIAALLLALSVGFNTYSKVRAELQSATESNRFLRKTIGDMTVAMTEKDKEIDRLSGVPCRSPDGLRPDSGLRLNLKAAWR